MLSAKLFLVAALLATATAVGAGAATVVDRPDTATTNRYYLGNRQPLEPSQFVPLPIGSVQPKGWLLAVLKRQRDGLCGHLGEISIWLQQDGNAWLSPDGRGKHGWEEVPYWLKGYLQLAYIFNDPKMIAAGETWIHGAINSQRADGDFGPDQKFDDDGSRDFWANMTMLFCLETYYEHSQDPRVIDLMTKYFQYHLRLPDNQLLTHYWQKMRGGDELYSIYWLYNRTGDAFLLDLADKIHRVTANWEMPGDLPNWHNVNIAECFRAPTVFWQQSSNAALFSFAEANYQVVMSQYGQVPGGAFGGDEVCRTGYYGPRQAFETCGWVELMRSFEILNRITGNPVWAERCEDAAANSFPAALRTNMLSLHYLTAPNQPETDNETKAPDINNSGSPWFSSSPSEPNYYCCEHNHGMGWPCFCEETW